MNDEDDLIVLQQMQERSTILEAAVRRVALGYHADTCGFMLSSEYPCDCHVMLAKEALKEIGVEL